MTNISTATVRTLAVLLIVAALLVSVSILPGMFSSNAENRAESDFLPTPEDGLPNFDLRVAKTAETSGTIDGLRYAAGRDPLSVDLTRSKIAAGAAALRDRLPDVVVEYNDGLGSAEVISPDVWKDSAQLLTPAGRGDRPTALKSFIKENSLLVGLEQEQIDSLAVTADYTNPDGNLSYTH